MSLDVLHVTGARPNFPKAAPVIRALDKAGVRNVLVHTGQHYDDLMSDIFFRELDLPRPDVNLGVGSGSHAVQTAAVMVALERELEARRPDLVVVYGDVNSAAAAAMVAAKMGIPVAHVEAGLRSFDRSMPEEINRIVTDQLSDLLLVTSPEAIAHLAHEGIDADQIFFVGNPMIDTLLANLDRFDVEAAKERHGLSEDYLVVTLHRPANVDDPSVAKELVSILHQAADHAEILFPLHPRGRATLEAAGLLDHPRIKVVEPLGYIDFISAVRGARAVLTDSGGLQEETTVLGIPCLTMRPNTERPITITSGTNQLVAPDEVIPALIKVLSPGSRGRTKVPPLWDGHAGARIAEVIGQWAAQRSLGSHG